MTTRFKRLLSKDADLMRAEKSAQVALYQYFRQRHGMQKEVSDRSGIVAPLLSQLANRPGQTIAMEAAIKLDLATDGQLKAEMLCPSEAKVIEKFLAARLKKE